MTLDCITCGAPTLRSELNGAHAPWCEMVAARNRAAHAAATRAGALALMNGSCTGCGVHRNERTPGCVNCRKRHEQRARDSAPASSNPTVGARTATGSAAGLEHGAAGPHHLSLESSSAAHGNGTAPGRSTPANDEAPARTGAFVETTTA